LGRQSDKPVSRGPVVEGTGRLFEFGLARLVGDSEEMQKVRKLIVDLSKSVASVLIQGETGTGKEIIAHALHATSRLSAGPFIALNCAAMPAGLLESELFGHARGAFTDAKSAKKGLLLQADGGTLLLDEIGELPLSMQPKLLRALQERTVRPIGEHQEVPFNCRLIAAANQDLEREVEAKRFREDLFYRLDVVRIAVPPLRARGADILLLALRFLEGFSSGSPGVASLSEAAAAKLLTYNWPGNVRELENCMARAVALSGSAELTLADLPEKIQRFELAEDLLAASLPEETAPIGSLFDAEMRHVLRAVEFFGGDKARAATLLRIDRRTLYRRLERYEAIKARARSAD
jgi:two-component system response regulator HydG